MSPVHQFLPRANRSNFNQSTSSPIAWTAVNTNESQVNVSFDQLAEYAIPPHTAAIQSAETCNIRNCRPSKTMMCEFSLGLSRALISALTYPRQPIRLSAAILQYQLWTSCPAK